MLEVRLLGKFDVRQNGEPVTITSRPAQSLFAYLILPYQTAFFLQLNVNVEQELTYTKPF